MPTNPYSTPCSQRYRAVHDSGVRPPSQIKWGVVHTTEGDTALGAASWFANPNSEGSANIVVDDDHCFKTVPDLRIPWAAPGANAEGFHVEIVGHAAWSTAEWLRHRATLERAAYKLAIRCISYDIPLVWRGFLGVRRGLPGLTTHRAITYAFPILGKRAGWHTDPGAGFPRTLFLNMVTSAVAELSV